jgi:hypothetical protein
MKIEDKASVGVLLEQPKVEGLRKVLEPSQSDLVEVDQMGVQ